MSSHWYRPLNTYGRSHTACRSRCAYCKNWHGEHDEWDRIQCIWCGKYCGRISSIEAMDRGYLPPPRSINALPQDMYDKPSLIDYERWNKVMDDLREQGAVLPFDIAFGIEPTRSRHDQHQQRAGRASTNRAKDTPPKTSSPVTHDENEEVEDDNQRTPRASSPSMGGDRAPDTEALPEEESEARSRSTKVDKADDAEDVQKGEDRQDESAEQEESTPLLEEGIFEEADAHGADRYALPTWAAVLRDYGRMVSRRVVYGVAVVM